MWTCALARTRMSHRVTHVGETLIRHGAIDGPGRFRRPAATVEDCLAAYRLKRAGHYELIEDALILCPGRLSADGESGRLIRAERSVVVDHNRERQVAALSRVIERCDHSGDRRGSCRGRRLRRRVGARSGFDCDCNCDMKQNARCCIYSSPAPRRSRRTTTPNHPRCRRRENQSWCTAWRPDCGDGRQERERRTAARLAWPKPRSAQSRFPGSSVLGDGDHSLGKRMGALTDEQRRLVPVPPCSTQTSTV
jgi:hypothetical protein